MFEDASRKVVESRLASLPEERQNALDSINRRYCTGKLSFEDARTEVEELVETLYKDGKHVLACVYNTKNLKVVEEYLNARYNKARRAKMADYSRARQESTWAVEALGELSIHVAESSQIQARLDEASDGEANTQRRLIFKMRAILNWLRPSERWKDLLALWDEEYKLVRYLTESEFTLVLKHLPSAHHKALAMVCYHLGCRVGEASALSLSDLKEARHAVSIFKQIRLEDQETRKVTPKTKNKKRRDAFIFPEGIPALKTWVEIKVSLTSGERSRLAETMTAACQKVFPNDETKHLTWHDLRHCYAIRLLDKGLTIDDVADMIGDSVVVAKKHYIGFIVSDARMERIKAKVLAG